MESLSSEIKEQKRIIEDELGSEYNKIVELEEQIKETQVKIKSTTAQILKNKTILNRLLGGFSQGND